MQKKKENVCIKAFSWFHSNYFTNTVKTWTDELYFLNIANVVVAL